jgi:hypothetical protein
MAEKEKQADVIDLSGCMQYNQEDLKSELRNVRAVIVSMLGYAQNVDTVALANALYTLQYLSEDVQYK